MVNNLDSNTSEIVLKKFVDRFFDSRVAIKTVDTDIISGELNPDTGDTVRIKRPQQAGVIETADGDISGSAKSNLISGSAPATVQNMITTATEYTRVEQALELNQLDELLAPFADTVVTRLETNLLTFMRNNASCIQGTPGTPLTQWSDVAQTASFMHSLGYGTDRDWYSVINPFGQQGLADTNRQLANGSDRFTDDAMMKAMIPMNFGGTSAYMHNSLPSRTAGTAAGTTGAVNGAGQASGYVAVKDTMQQTINIDGFGAGATLLAGDVLQFDTLQWVNQQSKVGAQDASANPLRFTATVLADATADGGGAFTNVLITSAIVIDATNPQFDNVTTANASGTLDDGDAVTVLGASGGIYQPNLFYSKGFCALGTVELPRLYGWDSMVMNIDGISIRQTMYSDGDTGVQKVRWDLLPAFSVLDPKLGGTFYGA